VNAELVDLGPCRALRVSVTEDRWAVVVPGSRGTALSAPTWYPYASFAAAGWSGVLVLDQFEGDDEAAWATDRFEAAIASVPAGARTAVIAKSLSSLLAPLVADRGLPPVWLTPLLRQREIADGIARSQAPKLIVAGTQDDLYDHAVAVTLGAELLELEGADHGLQLDGRPLESLELMRTVVERVTAFARGL
jgi:hypothetical protein